MKDHASNKGKGKEPEDRPSGSGTESVGARLQSSSCMAFNAMTKGRDLSSQLPGTKASQHIAPRYYGEASSQRFRLSGTGESIREPRQPEASAQLFDEFVQSSTLDAELVTYAGNGDVAVAQQEAVDGSAVLQLLDAPDELEGPGQSRADDAGLSPQAAEKLREALFADTPHWDALLDFTPEFLDPAEVQLHMGTSDAVEARRIWLQQWGQVLSAYTDQVWGDLEPLAAQARREVEQLQLADSDADAHPKALGRLRMILAHVRGRQYM